MKFAFCLIACFVVFAVQAQPSRKFSFEINYGLNANFFVGSYDEVGVPQNKTYLYKKNLLGTVSGIELKYHLNNHSSLFAAYSRTINKGEKNFSGSISGVDVFIEDFNIRHHNDFYQVGYERTFKKTIPSLKYHFGLVYARMQQQEIGIENFANQIIIAERKYKNSNLEEGGVFAGVHFQKKIDTKLELGLKLRAYYLISVSTFEALTLVPSLTYNF
jgi:hypothetical protein